MLNSLTIMGRICNDLELRRTPKGTSVSSFTIAVDRPTKQGEEKQTDFIDCVAWRQTAEFLTKYFSKGRMVVIRGPIRTRSYTDKDGNKRKAVEVIAEEVYFGDSKEKSQSKGDARQNTNSYDSGNYGGYNNPFSDMDDEDPDCPF